MASEHARRAPGGKPPRHTSRVYERELATLRERLLTMGDLVVEMMRNAEAAAANGDAELAQKTLLCDRQVNRLECETDELAMKILATRQPVASDLRFITSSLKVVTDLERIGDLSVNICDRVIELVEEGDAGASPEIVELAGAARAVVRDALDALVARDAIKAAEILRRDELIDEQYARIFRDILATMSRDPTTVYRATRVQSIAKYLERIADHAMNLAETVVFLVQGRDIRHEGKLTEDGGAPQPETPPK